MSHAAVYSEVLFWFMAVLTLLLVMFVGAVFTTRPVTARSPQPPGGRVGAHRQVRRHGAHRAGLSSGRERASAGRTGRHRAGVR